jgi:GT2 family glycosyltransferase
LEQQSLHRSQFEIVVADNSSPVGLQAVENIIDGRGRVILVQERGAGPARNGGVAACSGDILAFTDSDCVPDTNWLTEGVAALNGFDFVGGRVDVSVPPGRPPSPTEAFEKVFAFDFEKYINRKGFTGSGNLFVPRPIFEAVGGFGTDVSEDVDWSHRATSMGYRLGYAPKAIVAHPARANWSELKAKWVRINRETHGLYLRRSNGQWRWLLRSLLLPLSAVVHSPQVLLSPRLSSVRERAGALAILYRCRLWRFNDALKLVFRR